LVYLDLGANTISTPRIEKGISCLKISWSIADRRGDVPGAAMSLVNMGVGYYRLRKLDEAMQSLDWGLRMLRELTGRPVYGVLPWRNGLELDAEDSLALSRQTQSWQAHSLPPAPMRAPRTTLAPRLCPPRRRSAMRA